VEPPLPAPRRPRQRFGRRLREGTRPALALALAGLLAACAADDDPALRGSKSASATGARLAQIGGGGGHGLVTFRPYDGGLVMVADVGGLTGGSYRIVIHATPVCTSPNGFSAGPPLLLPQSGAPVVVEMTIHHQGTATITTRIPGLALSGPAGIEGRSVVLHANRSGSLEASPGVPNDRVACGVIGPLTSRF
jgi:superoxide dismutase, Cu-Zn family